MSESLETQEADLGNHACRFGAAHSQEEHEPKLPRTAGAIDLRGFQVEKEVDPDQFDRRDTLFSDISPLSPIDNEEKSTALDARRKICFNLSLKTFLVLAFVLIVILALILSLTLHFCLKKHL